MPAPAPTHAPALRLALYCPALPPARGGLADHTLLLARALVERGVPLVVLGRTGDPSCFDPIETVIGVKPLDGARGLVASVRRASARAVLVQYVPFLFARLGVAPSLVVALRRVRRAGVRVGVFVHEPYVPFTRPAWWVTGWPMRWQFRAVVRNADVVYAPVPRFLELARSVARPATRLALAPVGATIPAGAGSRAAARAALGLDDAEIAVGVFSPQASGIRADWLAHAAAQLPRGSVRWIFFGSGGDDPPAGFPPDVRSACLGWLEPARASQVFLALDVAAAPFADGLTLRRTSAMAALAHAVPLVSSRGPLFDPALADAAVCAASEGEFTDALRRLVTDGGLRERQGRRGRDAYANRASIAVLAAQVQSDLGGAT